MRGAEVVRRYLLHCSERLRQRPNVVVYLLELRQKVQNVVVKYLLLLIFGKLVGGPLL